ncbi:hypothetical protein BO94DRAFT_583050 [Aspergillus sclerotioniger CBS 115572]|uniref:Uncharacterized protein n=1 Tax=Aspergillus sclerotioniger CBS 115572 TaxID=1450535 RepID=A0A317X800_9EURO|nr:hypothetical protein BO94DRAFT_583050 [Aspergillus sclerotioniger CBS 115572]PWY93677.1 hypothetical protein BO94DRAFT_583050 [Aspergillus sclerotioniger CBS 115572]
MRASPDMRERYSASRIIPECHLRKPKAQLEARTGDTANALYIHIKSTGYHRLLRLGDLDRTPNLDSIAPILAFFICVILRASTRISSVEKKQTCTWSITSSSGKRGGSHLRFGQLPTLIGSWAASCISHQPVTPMGSIADQLQVRIGSIVPRSLKRAAQSLDWAREGAEYLCSNGRG